MEYTFEGLKAAFKVKLQLLSSWNKTFFHSAYERIIDAVTYIVMKLIYIAEVYYRESNWKTALNRDSYVNMCEILGYIPYRKKGALGSIVINADSTFDTAATHVGQNIYVSRWTVFTGDDKTVKVYSTEDVTYINSRVGNVPITVKEGTPKSYIYVATGVANEEIPLYSDSIDNDEIEVNIVDSNNVVLYSVNICNTGTNPEKIYFVDDLTEYYCEIENDSTYEVVTFIFGDGISSLKLTAGMRVQIKYAETNGAQGNIASYIINQFEEPVLDITGATRTIYVRNTEAIEDGSDKESLEDIKQNARLLFAAGYRAGGDSDWAAIINAQSDVLRSSVWTIADLGGSSLSSEQNLVFLTAISTDGDALTSTQQDDISAILEEKKSPTETLSWQTLEKIYIKFDIDAIITGETASVLADTIKTALDERYGVLYTDFQTNAYFSNYITEIDSLENVDHINKENTYASYMERNISDSVSNHIVLASLTSTDEGDATKQIYITAGSVELWLKIKTAGTWADPIQIAETTGASDELITATGATYTITSGAIIYANNEVSFTVGGLGGLGVANPVETIDDGYLLYLVYRCEDGNGNKTKDIRLPHFYQITDIDKSFIMTNLSY